MPGGRSGNPAVAPKGVGALPGFRPPRRVVGEILEAATAASGVVRTRRLDALRAGMQHLGRKRLRVTALDLRHTRPHGVAGKAAPHEDDEAVQPRDAVSAVRERVDRELELLVPRNGCGHEGPGYSGYAARLASAAGRRTGWFDRKTSSGSTVAFTVWSRRWVSSPKSRSPRSRFSAKLRYARPESQGASAFCKSST